MLFRFSVFLPKKSLLKAVQSCSGSFPSCIGLHTMTSAKNRHVFGCGRRALSVLLSRNCCAPRYTTCATVAALGLEVLRSRQKKLRDSYDRAKKEGMVSFLPSGLASLGGALLAANQLLHVCAEGFITRRILFLELRVLFSLTRQGTVFSVARSLVQTPSVNFHHSEKKRIKEADP